jgi:hypothetical protein
VAAVLLASASPALAGGVADNQPIAPGQLFIGVVNGQTGAATVRVVCDVPTGAGMMGHPVAGQTVAVRLVLGTPNVAPGDTGSAAAAIDVGLGSTPAVTPSVRLRVYEAPTQIPTSLVVPCSGAGVAIFNPDPTSPTARAGTVKITYLTPA